MPKAAKFSPLYKSCKSWWQCFTDAYHFYFFRLIVFFNEYKGSQHNVGVNVCIRHNQMMYGKSGDEWAIISLITQQSQVRMNKKYMDLNS